jgi:hypothetical protein
MDLWNSPTGLRSVFQHLARAKVEVERKRGESRASDVSFACHLLVGVGRANTTSCTPQAETAAINAASWRAALMPSW